MKYKITDHGSDFNILLPWWFYVCYILNHLRIGSWNLFKTWKIGNRYLFIFITRVWRNSNFQTSLEKRGVSLVILWSLKMRIMSHQV